MLHRCTDNQVLDYFLDYTKFVMAKSYENLNDEEKKAVKLSKYAYIDQLQDRKIIAWLEKLKGLLSPADLCYNLRNKVHEKRPAAPHLPLSQ